MEFALEAPRHLVNVDRLLRVSREDIDRRFVWLLIAALPDRVHPPQEQERHVQGDPGSHRVSDEQWVACGNCLIAKQWPASPMRSSSLRLCFAASETIELAENPMFSRILIFVASSRNCVFRSSPSALSKKSLA